MAKKFDIKDSGRIVPLREDGNILENEHGHPVEFESIVTSVTTGMFDLNKSTERQSPGAVDTEDNTSKWTGTTPKDDREYMAMIEKASSVDEKKAITEAYNKQQSTN